MSKQVEFHLNRSGVGKLLRCSAMQTACDNIASRVQPETQFNHGQQGDTRYTVLVHTNDPDETLKRFYGEATN